MISEVRQAEKAAFCRLKVLVLTCRLRLRTDCEKECENNHPYLEHDEA